MSTCVHAATSGTRGSRGADTNHPDRPVRDINSDRGGRRSMSAFERFARFSDRMFDRLRDKGAFTLTDSDAIDGDFESLRGRKYAVVVTFRRNGDAMPSPVWFGVDETGNVYLKTRHDAGKVKRLRNDSRALIAL